MDEYTPHYLNKSSNVPPVKVGSRREPSEDIVLACLDRRYFILGGARCGRLNILPHRAPKPVKVRIRSAPFGH